MTINSTFLDKYSPSFCAAKWTQVTIDLQHGTNHSCHHPIRHKIPIKELKIDKEALHNTYYKKKQRKKMLNGTRPKECMYCWNIEDADANSISDRHIKSNDHWSKPFLDDIARLDWKKNYNPKYLELFFSSKCNLSCSYCMADVSSSIEKEMDIFGPYPVKNRVTRKHRVYTSKKLNSKDGQLVIESFWRWLPEIISQLKVLRVTGGEPLIDGNFDKLIDYMLTDVEIDPDFTFAINTNLCVSDNLLFSLFDKLKNLIEQKDIKVELYTSLDTFGTQAEYIRHGLSYKKVLTNIEKFQNEFPNSLIVVMCCFNVLSIESFDLFLKDINKLKQNGKLQLDISYLKDPEYLCSKICTQTQVTQLINSLELMKKLDFSVDEVNKLKRIVMLLKTLVLNDYTKVRKDFVRFIDEYDKRKNKKFSKVFTSFPDF